MDLPRIIIHDPTEGAPPIKAWKATMSLRWVRPARATTLPDRLQQAFQEVNTGEIMWQDIPVEIVADAPAEPR